LRKQAGSSRGGELAVEVRHAVAVLDDVAALAKRCDGDDHAGARKLLKGGKAWVDQRDQAARAIFDWCRARADSTWGLVVDVVRCLWWHAWDVDPKSKRDCDAIKKAIQRTPSRE
jgi:hypothetical protein